MFSLSLSFVRPVDWVLLHCSIIRVVIFDLNVPRESTNYVYDGRTVLTSRVSFDYYFVAVITHNELVSFKKTYDHNACIHITWIFLLICFFIDLFAVCIFVWLFDWCLGIAWRWWCLHLHIVVCSVYFYVIMLSFVSFVWCVCRDSPALLAIIGPLLVWLSTCFGRCCGSRWQVHRHGKKQNLALVYSMPIVTIFGSFAKTHNERKSCGCSHP